MAPERARTAHAPRARLARECPTQQHTWGGAGCCGSSGGCPEGEREREKERERERERERESSDAAWGPEKCRLLLCRHADSDSGRATENGFSVS